MFDKKFMVALWSILTIGGMVMSAVIMFMAMESPTLHYSPYVGLGIAWFLTLPQFGLLVAAVVKRPDDAEAANAKLIKDIEYVCKIWKRDHGYPMPTDALIGLITNECKRDKVCRKQPEKNEKPKDENF